MSVFQRAAIAGAALVLAGVVSACSSGNSSESPSGEKTTESSSSPDEAGPQVGDPRDAAQSELCSLLPPEAATSLGLNPQGEEQADAIDAEAPSMCNWSNDSGSKSVAFTVFSDRSIQVYYDKAAGYSEFEKIKVAGHPAVTANKGDSMAGGSCNVYVAAKNDQIVVSQSTLPPDEVGEVDPCIMAKQALGKSIPTWPSAK